MASEIEKGFEDRMQDQEEEQSANEIETTARDIGGKSGSEEAI
jgi:hypothetical protein